MFCLSPAQWRFGFPARCPVSLLVSCLFILSSTHRHYENDHQEICFGCSSPRYPSLFPPPFATLRHPPSSEVLIILIKMNKIRLMFDFSSCFSGTKLQNGKQQQNTSETTSSADCWENFSPSDSMEKTPPPQREWTWRKTISYIIPWQRHGQPGP